MSKHSTKFKADDLINYDELLESSSMSRRVSFLTEIPYATTGIPTAHQGPLGIPIEPRECSQNGIPIGVVPTTAIPNEQHYRMLSHNPSENSTVRISASGPQRVYPCQM